MGVVPQTAQLFGDQGTRYTQMFVTTPLCCPSRSSILTGRYAHNTDVRSDGDPSIVQDFDQQTTLEAYLQGAGYRTGIFGKFLNSWPLDVSPSFFDRWAVFSRVLDDAYRDGPWNVLGTVRTVSSYATDFIRQRAKAFLTEAESNDAQPWFLYLAPPNPHLPSITKPRYQHAAVPPMRITPDMVEEDRSDKPPFLQGVSVELEREARRRARMLRAQMPVDAMVKGVFDQLAADGELHNTLAFFLSDNGYLYGEHGWDGKEVPYTPSIGSVMYARWPNHFATGSLDRRLVGNIDIAPTVLDAAGIEQRSSVPMDGRSLLEPRGREHLLTESWARPNSPVVPTWASLRGRVYQYVEYYDDEGHVTFREYYDLRGDPFELDNLLGDGDPTNDPDMTAMAAELAADRACEGKACP